MVNWSSRTIGQTSQRSPKQGTGSIKQGKLANA